MKHPFFVNIKALLLYPAAWAVIIIIHAFSIFHYYNLSVFDVLADILVFDSLLAVLGLALWYVVRYSEPGKKTKLNVTINLMTSFVFVLLIWFGISYGITYLLTNHNPEYKLYLHSTVTWRIASAALIYCILVLIYYLIIYYNNLQEKTLSEGRLNQMIREAELNLLKSQINPHFLFNSLNSASSLTLTNPDRAHEMIIKLSDYLRYSVSSHERKFCSFEMELLNCARYLDIEKTRFGSRLETFFEIDENCKQFQMPTMILQPLYENSVKHGVYESTEPIHIVTSARLIGENLEVTISNNFDPEAPSKKGAGIGLQNIKERMRLLYNSESLIHIKNENNTYIVRIIFPKKENL